MFFPCWANREFRAQQGENTNPPKSLSARLCDVRRAVIGGRRRGVHVRLYAIVLLDEGLQLWSLAELALPVEKHSLPCAGTSTQLGIYPGMSMPLGVGGDGGETRGAAVDDMRPAADGGCSAP